jgi:hypothetical protein
MTVALAIVVCGVIFSALAIYAHEALSYRRKQ